MKWLILPAELDWQMGKLANSLNKFYLVKELTKFLLMIKKFRPLRSLVVERTEWIFGIPYFFQHCHCASFPVPSPSPRRHGRRGVPDFSQSHPSLIVCSFHAGSLGFLSSLRPSYKNGELSELRWQHSQISGPVLRHWALNRDRI